ncbi:MAG: hypothetical protein BGO55_21860 [Sphingobacteriales bacterium 50-39]|nr:hypothetical protein [Sphingobacteriales bacterium]OJW59627.1 MAG: hypothetical protein BGO55_21860 [Sphingobacteriales bacterium 50-39]
MKLFYSLLLFISPFIADAQMSIDNVAFNTDGAANPFLDKAPKEWVKEQDQIDGHVPHSKLVKMQNATGAMISFLHDSCFSTTDFTPVWHGEYAIGRFGVQCRSEDRRGRLTIMSNDISPLLRYLTVNGKEFAGIRPSSGLQENYPYFEYEEEDHARTIYWLITPDSTRLPYIRITRKEYLQEARAELLDKKNSIIADIKTKTPIRSAAVQEAEKKAAIDELNNNYSGADLQVRQRLFAKEYHTDEEYLKLSIEKATAALDRTIHLMDSLSARSTAADLDKPAMVSVEAANFSAFEDNQADRNMLVKINPAYYANTGSDRPLLFLVSWSYDPAGADASNIDHQVRENIDFRQLKALLSK